MFYQHSIRTLALLSSKLGDFITHRLDQVVLFLARAMRADVAVWLVRVRWFLSVRPEVRAVWAEVLRRFTTGSANHES